MRSTPGDHAPMHTTTHVGLRHRLGNLSESMMSILNVPEAKDRGLSGSQDYNVLVSRIVVLLFLATLVISVFGGVFHTVVLLFGGKMEGVGSSVEVGKVDILQGFESGLAVEQYPAVLVDGSEEFKGKGAEVEAEQGERSLVSAPSDVEVSKAVNVDSDEEPVARLIVITMDREDSLRRLLGSLVKANYGEDHVDLDIWIDRSKEKGLHEGVLHACRGVEWKWGTKTVHKRRSNAGLYEQWIYTWNITEETTEFAVILEDDLEVSPAFYQWLRVARAAYAQDTDVGAFTLQRSTLRPRQIKHVATGNLNISSDYPVFKYRLLGTWGFAPQRDQWVEFRKWFEEKKKKGEKPYVDGLITTKWYKSQEEDGFAPTMWSQWWIKFVDEKGYFTVTAHLPDGTTLASNWREAGLHYSSTKPKVDFPIFRGNDEQFVMPDNLVLVDWDGLIISGNSSSTS